MHSHSKGYQASLHTDPMTFLKHEQLQCSIVYLATWQFLFLMENAKMFYYNAQGRINEVFKSIVWETWGKCSHVSLPIFMENIAYVDLFFQLHIQLPS